MPRRDYSNTGAQLKPLPLNLVSLPPNILLVNMTSAAGSS